MRRDIPPSETPRAIVLGEVVAALNKADDHGARIRRTSVTRYREAVRAAMTPMVEQPPPTLDAPPPNTAPGAAPKWG